MGALEICLVVIGAIVIAVSFIFSEQLQKDDTQEMFFRDGKFSEVAQEIIKKEVEKELSLIVDEKLDDVKKEMNKVSAEKILAMGEYSEDINLRINKNHEEVMFLYNMLNDKEAVVKNTMKDIEALKVSIKKMSLDNNNMPVNESQTVPNMTDAVTSINAVDEADRKEINKAESVKDDYKKQSVESKKSSLNEKSSNNNKKILELYHQGLSSVEIAKKLGLGVGEVSLVIDLFNSKK